MFGVKTSSAAGLSVTMLTTSPPAGAACDRLIGTDVFRVTMAFSAGGVEM